MSYELTMKFTTFDEMRRFIESISRNSITMPDSGHEAFHQYGGEEKLNVIPATQYVDEPTLVGTLPAGGTFPQDVQIAPGLSGNTVTSTLPEAAITYPTPGPVQQFANETAAAAGVEVELDKDGVPWDARIHAKTKTKTVKGVWKRAKGLDDAVYDAVTAELKAARAKMQSVAAPMVVEGGQGMEATITPMTQQDPAAVFGQPSQASEPVLDPNTVFSTPAPQMVDQTSRTWADICDAAHAAQMKGACDLAVFTSICSRYGYSEAQHGKGMQAVGNWCENQTDQPTKNAIWAELNQLATRTDG